MDLGFIYTGSSVDRLPAVKFLASLQEGLCAGEESRWGTRMLCPWFLCKSV